MSEVFLYECVACLLVLTAEDLEERIVKWATDKAHDGNYRLCRDRDACNARRLARVGAGEKVPYTPTSPRPVN